MSFDALMNPITGEYGVMRQRPGPGDGLMVADLYARPNAAVVGEHIHPRMTESFTVVRGRLGLRIDGREDEAAPGTRVSVPPGTAHDWWNTGHDTAWVIVEVDPGAGFEAMIRNLYCLAADGRTDSKGRPSLLQASLMAKEFDEVIRFTKPPRAVQQILFSVLAPIARRRGLRGSYPEYLTRVTAVLEEIEALPPEIAALLPASVPRGTGGVPQGASGA